MRLTPLNMEVRRSRRVPREKWNKQGLTRWAVLVAIYLLVVALTAPFYAYKPPTAIEDILATDQPVRSWTDFRFVSQKAREEFQAQREREHKRKYGFDADIHADVLDTLANIYESIDSLNPAEQSSAALLNSLRKEDTRLGFLTEEEVAGFVLILKDPRFRSATLSIINEIYDNHVLMRNEEVTRFRAAQESRVVEIDDPENGLLNRREILETPFSLPPDWLEWRPLIRRINEAYGQDAQVGAARRTAELLLSAILQPNLTFDEERTRDSYESFPVRDLSVAYREGEVLVDRDSLRRGLSDEEIRLLQEHRDAVRLNQDKRVLGHAAFVLIVFILLSFYVRRYKRELTFSPYTIILISLPVVIALALEAAIVFLADGKTADVGYLFPAGAIGLLGVLLLDIRMALLLVTWGCLLMGLQLDLNYDFVIVGLFGGYTAVAALATIRKRWEVFAASFLVGVVNAAVIFITGYIREPGNYELQAAALGFFSGISSFLVLAILPVFERFGIITDIQLLELTGLQHPLLREVEEQAPGTWQHTLNVTKLAEAAATEIGVNYLLVRAGCYFHDIGKAKKPEYFTENQITNEDKSRHDSLKPIMSARVIMNHVKEGVEMARAAKLPERIIDFIVQHHGTTVITYFYNKALAAHQRGELKETVRVDDYRYPGVKPQIIEAAIVMLADSVEATATAKLSGRTVRLDDIQQIVRNTILDKFNDGQFDECNLTLRDLNIIRETFVEVLQSRFHTRIDYPKKPGAAPPAPAKDKRPEKSRDRISKEKERTPSGTEKERPSQIVEKESASQAESH